VKILVTSAQWKGALILMRSLGKMGHEISLICDDPYSPHLYSKYCKKSIISPKEENKEIFVNFLIDHIKKEKYDLLVPISDLCVEYCSSIRDEINRCTNMFLPDKNLLEIALDKVKTYKYAIENDVDIPLTYFPESVTEVKEIAEKISYPCVVKKGRGFAGIGNSFMKNDEELIEYFSNYCEQEWPVIQEYVDGDSYGFMAVCNDGKILDYFIFKRLRQIPEKFGISVYAESIYSEDMYNKMSILVKRMKWTGAVALDYFMDSNGKVILLEINPRLCGLAPFAYKCGIDLPACFLNLMIDKNFVKNPTKYSNGKLWRSIFPEEINSCRFNRKYILDFIVNFFNPRIVHDIDFSDLSLLKWQIKKAKWGIVG